MSKRILTITSTVILLLIFSCKNSEPQKLHNEKFNWSIALPSGFNKLSSEEWQALQNKGQKLLEDQINDEIDNKAKTIFVFKKGDFNYFEANYQPFDAATDGNYDETFREVSSLLHDTFMSQLPSSPIDSSYSKVTISGLIFNKFELSLEITPESILHSHLYSRLFGEDEFTVSIMYLDEGEGKKLLDAWLNSTFEN